MGEKGKLTFNVFLNVLIWENAEVFFQWFILRSGQGFKAIPELSKLIHPPPSKANNWEGLQKYSALTVLSAERFLIFSLLVSLSPGASLSHPLFQRLPT